MRDNIEAERGRHQMSREGISRELGITSKTYLSYVRGENPVPSDKLEKMADMFNCTTDYLLGLSDNRNRAS